MLVTQQEEKGEFLLKTGQTLVAGEQRSYVLKQLSVSLEMYNI